MPAVILFSVLASLVFAIFFFFGLPLGHSYVLNITWTSAFTDQFLAGDLYPRWLFETNQGAGSPVFYFYGPLLFWVNAIFGGFLCPGCTVERSVMVGPCVLMGLSGIAFYCWARQFARPSAALIAAVLYFFLPYHLAIDLWWRSAFAELAAYVWMPVILLGLTKAPTSVWHVILAAAGYAGLIYAHIPSALLFSPVMVLFVLIRHRPSLAPRALALPVILGLGLAAAYLVPALTTQDYINASAWWNLRDGHYDARNWLWLDGRDANPLADVLLFAFLMTTAASAYMAIDLWIRGHGKSRILVFGVVSLLYAWFLMTYPSSFLWEHIESLRKVQFPWRLGIVVDLCAAAIAALWLDHVLARTIRGPAFKVYLCVPLVLFGIFYASSAMSMYEHLLSIVDPDGAQPIGEYDAPEYRTSWLVKSGEGLSVGPLRDKLDEVPQVSLVSGDGTVSIARQDLDELEIAVEARTPVRVRIRRFYYPGWSLIDGATGASYETDPSQVLGLLEADLPSGAHSLVLSRQAIEEERLGTLISAATLIACLVLIAGALAKKRVDKARGAGPRFESRSGG